MRLRAGTARVKPRDSPAAWGTDGEAKMRQPDDPFFKRFAAECSRVQIAVDIFSFWCGPPHAGAQCWQPAHVWLHVCMHKHLAGVPSSTWSPHGGLPVRVRPGEAWKRLCLPCLPDLSSSRMVACSAQSTDVASLAALPRYTCGQLYFYPRFLLARDGARLASPLHGHIQFG